MMRTQPLRVNAWAQVAGRHRLCHIAPLCVAQGSRKFRNDARPRLVPGKMGGHRLWLAATVTVA